MTTPKILTNIKSLYPGMNPAMKRIADYIINNFEKVAFMGITELSENSEVSDATVSRFVKIMGFKNYKAFQLGMVGSLSDYEETNPSADDDDENSIRYGSIAKGDSVHTICRKVFRGNIQMLRDTLDVLDYDAVEKVSDLIIHARNVIFYGVGRSSIVAESGRLRLYRLGLSVFSYEDSNEQVISSCMVDKNDVVIAISNYGRSKSVIEGVKRAKEMGATTVGLTSAKDSPLAKSVDICLYNAFNHDSYRAVKRNITYESSSENIAQIAILDTIYICVAMQIDAGRVAKYYMSALALESEKM